MRYNIEAKTDYPEQKDVHTPMYSNLTHEGAYEFVKRLLQIEKDAEKFIIEITVVK